MVWHIPLVSVAQLSQLCPFPKPCTAYWWRGGMLEKTVLLQPKHRCVINTFPAPSAEHSTGRKRAPAQPDPTQIGWAFHTYSPCLTSLPCSKVLPSQPVPQRSPGSSGSAALQRALNPSVPCSKQPGPDCTHPHILQQASLPVTQSIHLLPNSSCSGHRGNEAIKVMRLEEHHAMQNSLWCQLVKAEAPLLLLHSPTMKVAVLEWSVFSVNLNSMVFSALSFFPSLPDHHKEVWCMCRWEEMEKQESWSAEAAQENLFKQASTHCKESSPVQSSLSPDLG